MSHHTGIEKILSILKASLPGTKVITRNIRMSFQIFSKFLDFGLGSSGNNGLSTSVIDLLKERKSLIYFIVNESKSSCAMYAFVFLHA